MEPRSTDLESPIATGEPIQLSDATVIAAAADNDRAVTSMQNGIDTVAGEKTHANNVSTLSWDTDPENPLNWSTSKKWAQVGMASSFAIIA